MQEEIWKDIKGYEGYYQVSNYGRVKSLDRIISSSTSNTFYKKGQLIKLRNKKGYYNVSLSKNNKSRHFIVNKLVATAFIDNPNNYNQTNHKDENPLNNYIENLEWCNSQYNNTYGTKLERVKKTMIARNLKMAQKVILQFDLNENFIREWDSASQIHKAYGYNIGFIGRCCKIKNSTGYNYIWRYKDEVNN